MVVSLPLYPTLTEDEQDAVVAAFRKVCEEYARA
jgi:dTDP-4-amino-4,6-dideoxygalactose transaminase